VATVSGEKLLVEALREEVDPTAFYSLFLSEINKNCCRYAELLFLTPICTKSFVGWADPIGGAYSVPRQH